MLSRFSLQSIVVGTWGSGQGIWSNQKKASAIHAQITAVFLSILGNSFFDPCILLENFSYFKSKLGKRSQENNKAMVTILL